MKIVSITRLLDEADIIEAFVRHTAYYASHLVFIDNGSRDGTLEILAKLAEEGFSLLVYRNKSVSFSEAPFNTKMFVDAVRLFDADWVLCLDADEFIDDSRVAGGLVAVLHRLQKEEPRHLVLDVPLYEYRRSREDDATERNVVHRQTRHLAPYGINKMILAGALATMGVTVGAGNHHAFVEGAAVASCVEPGLRLAHFAERSHHQIAAKWIKGWAKVLATGITATASGASMHYRGPFEILRDRPEQLLRNGAFMSGEDHAHFVRDAAVYRGGELLYTGPIDDEMRSFRMIIGYLEALATRYGFLVETIPAAAAAIEAVDGTFEVIVGQDLLIAGGPSPAHLTTKQAPNAPQRIGAANGFDAFKTRFAARRAARAIEGQDFETADRLLERSLRRWPTHNALLNLYAFSAHNSARHTEAVIRWAAARKAAPDDPMTHAGIAANLRELGALDFAAQVIGAALVSFPADPTILTEASRIAVTRGCVREALELIERTILLVGPMESLIVERDRLAAGCAA